MAYVYDQSTHIPLQDRFQHTLRLVLPACLKFIRLCLAILTAAVLLYVFDTTPALTWPKVVTGLVLFDWFCLSYKTRRFC